ncbi:hypothetical protein Tco_1038929 [Tanacetum coccineum]
MSSMMSCGGVPIASNDVVGEVCGIARACWWLGVADMMALYCQNAVEDDSEFAKRMGVLLQEMVAAYDDRVDFIRELEVVPGITAAVKTT